MRQQHDGQAIAGCERGQTQLQWLAAGHRQWDRGIGDSERGLRYRDMSCEIDETVHGSDVEFRGSGERVARLTERGLRVGSGRDLHWRVDLCHSPPDGLCDLIRRRNLSGGT